MSANDLKRTSGTAAWPPCERFRSDKVSIQAQACTMGNFFSLDDGTCIRDPKREEFRDDAAALLEVARVAHGPAQLRVFSKCNRTLLVLALSAAALAFASRGSVAADTKNGKQLFEDNCAVCHKSDGSGGIKLGTVTSADLRAPALEHMYHDSDAQLARSILDGKNEDGEALDPVMPHWRGRLTRPELAAIIVFLKTLHP